MPTESTKLKIPMPLGTEFFTRTNFLAILQAIEDNAVPYTGATKDVDLGSRGMKANTYAFPDGNGDGYYFQWNEDADSGKLALKSRRVSDGSIYNGVYYATPEGIVNLPKQPYVSVAQTSSISLGAGVDVKIPFSTEYQDSQSEFNNGTGTYTPKENGVYLLTTMLVMSAQVAGFTDFVIFENGAVLTRASAAVNERSTAYSRQINLEAGKQYTFYIQSDSALSLNTAALQITKIA